MSKGLLEKINSMYGTNLKLGDRFYIDDAKNELYFLENKKHSGEHIYMMWDNGGSTDTDEESFTEPNSDIYYRLLFADKITKVKEKEYVFKITDKFVECLPIFKLWFDDSEAIVYIDNKEVIYIDCMDEAMYYSKNKFDVTTMTDKQLEEDTYISNIINKMLELDFVEKVEAREDE